LFQYENGTEIFAEGGIDMSQNKGFLPKIILKIGRLRFDKERMGRWLKERSTDPKRF